jgi:hypothetical protein
MTTPSVCPVSFRTVCQPALAAPAAADVVVVAADKAVALRPAVRPLLQPVLLLPLEALRRRRVALRVVVVLLLVAADVVVAVVAVVACPDP